MKKFVGNLAQNEFEKLSLLKKLAKMKRIHKNLAQF